MALEWLDNLNETQAANAKQIIKQAKEIGVDPILAVTVAFHESGLTHNDENGKPRIGDNGEVGMWQVRPPTAEMMGYKPEDLSDPKKNTQIGLSYLKQGIDKFKDPVMAVAGYNAGMDHKALTTGEQKLPKSTMDYLTAIKVLGGFEQPETEVTPASDEDFQKRRAEALAPYQTPNAPVPIDVKRDVAGAVMGAGIGGVGGLGVSTTQKLNAIANNLAGQPNKPTTGVQNWTREMGYKDRGGLTYGQAHQFESGERKGATINNKTPTFRFAKPPVNEPSLGSRVLGSNTISGALSGGIMGGLGQEASTRYNAGDMPGAVIGGLGAAGQVVRRLPLPYASQIGTGMSLASPAALAVLDRIRANQAATPEQYKQPPTMDELDTASTPAFVYPRP